MPDPASGTAAATGAVAMTTGTMLGISQIMPAGASFYEFLWGCIFAIAGAFAYQFICAQSARQKAADANVPINERPKIDMTMVGYAMFGAPMSAACIQARCPRHRTLRERFSTMPYSWRRRIN